MRKMKGGLLKKELKKVGLPSTIIEGENYKMPSHLMLSVQQSIPLKHGEGKFSLRDMRMIPHTLCLFELDETPQ